MRKDPNKITNGKTEITTNTREIQIIIREHYEKLYASNLELEEIDQFLEIYNIAKMKKEEIKNLNRQITSKEIESGIPGWRSGLAPAFGPGSDPGDPGSNPTSGSRCMEPASPSACVSASLSHCVPIINK